MLTPVPVFDEAEQQRQFLQQQQACQMPAADNMMPTMQVSVPYGQNYYGQSPDNSVPPLPAGPKIGSMGHFMYVATPSTSYVILIFLICF